jgi:hypothetical protein
MDEYFSILGNRGYTFHTHIHGYFSNFIVNTNAAKLSELFSRERTFISKEKEFVATSTDEVLVDALFCCVAIAFDIEATRNYMSHVLKKKATKKIAKDISSYLVKDESKRCILEKLILEIFIVRDSIAHAHLHQVKVKTENFKSTKISIRVPSTIYHEQGDLKYSENVFKQTKKTKVAGLNVTIPKISFVDVIKALIILDIVYKYAQFGKDHPSSGPIPFHFDIDEIPFETKANLGHKLFDISFGISYFLNKCRANKFFVKEIRKFLKKIKRTFPDIPTLYTEKYLVYDFLENDHSTYDFLKASVVNKR